MLVRFDGGPLDGQSHEISEEPAVGATIIWPPNADLTKHDDAIPGSDDVVETSEGLVKGPAGLLDPSVDTPSGG